MIQNEALPAADAVVADVEAAAPDVVALAELVSIAVRVEPELLRRMRLKMLPRSHAGTEADLWFSPLVESRGPGGFVFDGDIAQVLRARLRANPDRLSEARETVKTAHAHLTPAITIEEELTFVALAPMEAADRANDIQAVLRRVLKTMVTEEPRENDLARWALRAMPRLPEGARNSEAGWLLALSAGARLDGREVMSGEPPQGALDELQALLPTKSEPVTIGARLVTDGLEISYPADPRAHSIEVPNTTPILVSTGGDRGRTRRQSTLRWDEVRVIPAPGQSARIETADGAVFSLDAPVPDLTVTLVGASQQPDVMTLSFASPHPPAIADSSPTLIRLSRSQITDFARTLEKANAASEIDLMIGIGKQIGDLLPPDFWAVYHRLFELVVDRVPRVLFLTDEPRIPWELAVVPDTPRRLSGREAFMGQEVELATWITTPRSPAPTPFALDAVLVLVVAAIADLRLPGVAAEVEELVNRLGAVQIEPSIGLLQPWLDGRYRPDIIHLAGVSAISADGSWWIPLNDGRIDDKTVRNAHLPGVFVFLNLDSVGQAGGLITGLLAAGAAGVIATPSHIDDRDGQATAASFYERILNGDSPAAALRKLRQEAIDQSARYKTALSYRYFGHPSTTLRLGYGVAVWDIAKGEVIGSLVGHHAPIRSIDYSADGSMIATGGDDATVRVWRAATGRQIYSFAATGPVGTVAFSPDGSRVAAVSNDDRITIFALGAGIQLVVGLGDGTNAIAWSPAGDRIAYVDREGRIGIFDTLAGGGVSEEYTTNRPTAIEWSGRRLVVADGDNSLVVFDGDGTGRRETIGLETMPITALSAFPDGSRVASVDRSGVVGVWDLSGRFFSNLGDSPDGVVQSLQVVGEQVLAVTDHGLIGAWDVAAGTGLRSFPPVAPNQGAVLAPDGAHVATFTRHPLEPGSISPPDLAQQSPEFASEAPGPSEAPAP